YSNKVLFKNPIERIYSNKVLFKNPIERIKKAWYKTKLFLLVGEKERLTSVLKFQRFAFN
ncbi:hypothetical protein J5H52_13715, partial [Providencia rettgeri]|uniref:hypothetical protein n=1 Tax=Providencia rettgeri TaxID=587 RepID=UPI001AAE8900